MRFGADYYPEHWPQSRWATDARLMQEAGFNVVRMAEFAWAKLEPEEGTYDFDWLDAAIRLLGAHGIQTVLGTPTAIPPDWLVARHPDILPVDERGLTRREGTRRHYRYGSKAYQEFCARIVRVMASHYSDNPDVIGWQIDNEWGCHSTTYEYGEESRRQFQAWLRGKYGSLQELNRRWGTAFWSQTFHTWDAIPLPWYAPADHNPSLMLDFRRWSSRVVADFQRIQIDILRRANPEWFVTHNFMGAFDEVDGVELSRDLDFASWDNYPLTTWGGSRVNIGHAAFAHDVTRGFKNRNFWVMEQLAGPTGAGVMSPNPRPGQIPFLAWQSIAHGADGLVFFRWRTCPFGAEQYWHGILEHDGSARRRYREVAGMGGQLQSVGAEIEGATVPAEIAILRDFESCWAYRIQKQTPDFSYDGELQNYHAALRTAHLPCDVISSHDDFSRYKALFAPCLHLVSEATAQKLRNWVENGGVLLGAFRFGVKDGDNRVVEQPLPGLLRDVFGVIVEEYDAMGTTLINHITPGLTQSGGHLLGNHGFETRWWSDVLRIESETAEVLARYDLDYYAEQPAISLNRVGKGCAIYVGTSSPNCHFYDALVSLVTARAAVQRPAPELNAPPWIELMPRITSEGRMLMFVLNGHGETSTVEGTDGYINLLAGGESEPLGSQLFLPPWGVALLAKI